MGDGQACIGRPGEAVSGSNGRAGLASSRLAHNRPLGSSTGVATTIAIGACLEPTLSRYFEQCPDAPSQSGRH